MVEAPDCRGHGGFATTEITATVIHRLFGRGSEGAADLGEIRQRRRRPGPPPQPSAVAGVAVLVEAAIPNYGNPAATTTPAEMEGRRRLAPLRPVHRLLPRHGGQHLPMVMAGLRGLPLRQRRHRPGVGVPSVRPGPAQPHEMASGSAEVRHRKFNSVKPNGSRISPAATERMARSRIPAHGSMIRSRRRCPTAEWQQAWPPGSAASREALARLIGPAYPLDAT